MTFDPIGRARRWNDRWRPIVPIFVAEFVAVVGFGALLPVLPLYVVEQGVDTTTLGVILAAWPAARLIFEPIFGWLADRTSRRALMLGGLVVLTFSTLLPLAFHAPLELFILRFISGLAVSMYDPAARGTIVDETEDDERGEAFGLYSAAQMGGFIFGPVIGAVGAAAVGSFAFAFVAAGVSCMVAVVYLFVAFHPRVQAAHPTAGPRPTSRRAPLTEGSYAQLGPDSPEVAQRVIEASRLEPPTRAPLRELWNRPFVAALIMNFGIFFAIGVYEVVWALYLQDLGGSVEWIGLTYVLFALPVVLLAPLGGRLVDRHGATPIRRRRRSGGCDLRLRLRSRLGTIPAGRGHRHRGRSRGVPGPRPLCGRGHRHAHGPGLDGAGHLWIGRHGRLHRLFAGRRLALLDRRTLPLRLLRVHRHRRHGGLLGHHARRATDG